MEGWVTRMAKHRYLRFYTLIILSIFMSLNMLASPLKASQGALVDILGVAQGTVTLNYSLDQTQKVKVMVEKNGKSLYYNLKGREGTESFPLQMGSGTYTVAVLENVSGNQYRYLAKETVDLTGADALGVYLQSVQLVKWEDNDPVIQKARELTKELKSDSDKLAAIYGYVVDNYRYDYSKLGKLPADYIPNINTTESTKTGICYDFAAVLASMLRSVDIPAKLVKGYGDAIDGYHAWNEVYIEGKWKPIDTSYDIQMKEHAQKYAMFKDPGKYDKVSEF